MSASSERSTRTTSRGASGESGVKASVRWLMAIAMVFVGVLHFVRPAGFVAIVPRALPYPLFLVYSSGLFEIAFGVGLCFERTRRISGWGLVALYFAVFPANVNMAVHDIQPTGMHLSAAAMWGRLPLQAVLIGLAYWMTRPPLVSSKGAAR